MSERYRKLLSTTLLCGSMILTGSNAWADDTSFIVRSYKVSYAELNLSNEPGVEELYGRIRRAARRVCNRGQRVTLSTVVQERECRADAIADAVAQVKNARLAAHHREKAQSNQG
jgi:UrcA family protein